MSYGDRRLLAPHHVQARPAALGQRIRPCQKQNNIYEEPVIEIVVFDENDFLLLSGNEVTPGEDGGIGLPDFGL